MLSIFLKKIKLHGFLRLYEVLFNQIIAIKKKRNIKIIINNTNNCVIDGPYKSTFIISKSNWGGSSDLASKLLGFYEKEVQETILKIAKQYSLRNFVNFGASDGYHVLGLLKNKIFNNALAFEINPISRKALEENVKSNYLVSKVKIFNEANFEIVQKNLNDEELKKTLFLIDIEGEEYNLFKKINLEKFKSSFFIIEDHSFMIKNEYKKKFFTLINSKYVVKKITTSSRNPFKFDFLKKLGDDERWLLASEGRTESMSWLVLYPKN